MIFSVGEASDLEKKTGQYPVNFTRAIVSHPTVQIHGNVERVSGSPSGHLGS